MPTSIDLLAFGPSFHIPLLGCPPSILNRFHSLVAFLCSISPPELRRHRQTLGRYAILEGVSQKHTASVGAHQTSYGLGCNIEQLGHRAIIGRSTCPNVAKHVCN